MHPRLRLHSRLPVTVALAVGVAVSCTVRAPVVLAQSPPSAGANSAASAAPIGYYRFPAIHGHTLVFTAEGDLWRVSTEGGVAERLTSHPGQETHAAISPDGSLVAFCAEYEGAAEVYTMPLAGGTPVRRTFQGGASRGGPIVVGWTSDGKVLYSTAAESPLSEAQLATIDVSSGHRERVPLSEAADGAYDADGVLYFTRLEFQGSHTRRYRGGTAQQIWKFAKGASEAVPLTRDYPGTSKNPMWWQGRVFFLSDRDGTMNLWSMTGDGGSLQQLTHHGDFDILSASLSDGRIAYQMGADVWIYDVGSGTDAPVSIRLTSDFDQTRERWVESAPDWISSAHLSPSGDRVALTARGQVFVAPAGDGRLVEVTPTKHVRYRNARFFADGKSLLALSDSTGELEFWSLSTNGLGTPARLTRDATVLRWDGVPSPDGRFIAFYDKNYELWLFDRATGKDVRIAVSRTADLGELRWSPDSRWLAFVEPAVNTFTQIALYGIDKGTVTLVTSDRYNSRSPAWGRDGAWLYFLSDRNLVSLVDGPWGPRAPEPFFDHGDKIYALALHPGLRSPFEPADELHPQSQQEGDSTNRAGDTAAAKGHAPPAKGVSKAAPAPVAVTVVLDGIMRRIVEVPIRPGNYDALSTDGKRLYFLAHEVSARDSATGAADTTFSLLSFPIENDKPHQQTFLDGVVSYELSLDGKKLLVRTPKDFLVIDASAKAPAPDSLAKLTLALKDWKLHFSPRDEWRQMYLEAWRLERDYFYDRHMHGLDWSAMRAKYLPLVDRVADREELSDILGQMVAELSALHIFVFGGDARQGQDHIAIGALGATFAPDPRAGGYRVVHIERTDPDLPNQAAPLARPGVEVKEGETITDVNGVAALSAPDIGALLRDQAGKQVLLRVRSTADGAERSVIVVPDSQAGESDRRYNEWEYARRLIVDSASGGHIGYVHLRSMVAPDMAQFARDYYPIFNRDGLIIDMRHNFGGDVDSWVLERLLRKAWFYWQSRVGDPYWNMQYAFRGHMLVLVDEWTSSDGEAFSEGFRRLGLGKVIGTRTWGGEIWLSASNFLVDRGIATAAEDGVYGPEGAWLIEGHGVDPDSVVDNLPHATYAGDDAQLRAGIAELQREIKEHPVPVPPAPPYPNKAVATRQDPASPARSAAPNR